MVRVLLAAHPTAGHTNALRAIGKYMLNQDHKVAMTVADTRLPFIEYWPAPFQAAAALPKNIEKDGIEFLPLKFPLAAAWYSAQIPRATGIEELAIALKFFTAGIEQQARQIANHVQQWKADAIVADFLMPAAMLAAQLSNRPYAALYHSALPFPVKDAPPMGTELGKDASPDSEEWRGAMEKLQQTSDFFDKKIADAAKKLGLSFNRQSLMSSPISEDLNLLATTPELEPGLLPLQGPVVMTGPCLPSVKNAPANDPALNIPRDDRPRVYVSLGTVFNGKPHIFKAILEGLSGLGVQAIVSAGSSYDSLIGQAENNVHIFRRVPQVALLPTVDIVITHGGNNTVQETLNAGKPMVVVPFGGDQMANARRVQVLGVGAAVFPAQVTADSICAAVKKTLEPAMVERAQALGDSLKEYHGVAIASSKILELVNR